MATGAIFWIMKLPGSWLMAATLLLAAGGRAQDDNSAVATAVAAAPDTPYAAIVARNMFNLVPILPPDPDAGKPPPEPPPKITPNGIVTIFGRPQAIFKVANKPKPGQPQKDDSYVLAEGEMQDEITVVKINLVEGLITFNNHGTVQELALTPAKESGAGGGPGGGPGGPGGPRGGAGPGNPGAIVGRTKAMGQQFGGVNSPFPGRNPNVGGGIGNPNSAMGIGGGTEANNAAAGITYLGGTPVNANRVYQPVNDPSITPEQTALMIETQRKMYEQQGNPTAKLLPLLPGSAATRQMLDQLDSGAPPQ